MAGCIMIVQRVRHVCVVGYGGSGDAPTVLPRREAAAILPATATPTTPRA